MSSSYQGKKSNLHFRGCNVVSGAANINWCSKVFGAHLEHQFGKECDPFFNCIGIAEASLLLGSVPDFLHGRLGQLAHWPLSCVTLSCHHWAFWPLDCMHQGHLQELLTLDPPRLKLMSSDHTWCSQGHSPCFFETKYLPLCHPLNFLDYSSWWFQYLELVLLKKFNN